MVQEGRCAWGELTGVEVKGLRHLSQISKGHKAESERKQLWKGRPGFAHGSAAMPFLLGNLLYPL